MRQQRRRSILLVVLLALSHRIKTSQGVKEIIHEAYDEPTVFSARGFDTRNNEEEEETHDRYIVKFKNANVYRMASYDMQDDGTHIMALPKENSEVMTLKTLNDVQRMEERDDVEYVELDHKVYLQSDDNVPYGIRMVKALLVSDEFMSNQRVCIIDSGYAKNHPDLPAGVQRVTGSSNGAGSWFKDGNGHGTHVAGVIAAMENDEGIVGINQGGMLNLHIVRVFRNDGNWAWASSLVAAADECVDNEATVINMSLGGPEYSQFERDRFQEIYNDGILLVAAAGNDGSTDYLYPASYPSVISVGAVNSNKRLASFSQRNDQVDLTAPGVSVRSTVPSGGYLPMSGTSMAAPHVSGVAALVWSHFPDKSAQEIRQALQESAQDLGPTGKDIRFGHGLVNANRAFKFLLEECFETCENSPIDWHDSDGTQYDCDWYAEGDNCQDYGNDYENFGKTANEACCSCGGGETVTCQEPTPAPTQSPTKSPTPQPIARPTQEMPPTGPPVRLETPTGSPIEAPIRQPTQTPTRQPTRTPIRQPTKDPTRGPTRSPSRSPTREPTEAPTRETESPTPEEEEEECEDEPEYWHDADGPEYDCEWYAQPGEDRCRLFGDLFENFGKTASEACCVCGGGTTPCEDIEDWHDSDGEEFDCEWYSEFRRCEKFGHEFENFGYTANEACCECRARLDED